MSESVVAISWTSVVASFISFLFNFCASSFCTVSRSGPSSTARAGNEVSARRDHLHVETRRPDPRDLAARLCPPQSCRFASSPRAAVRKAFLKLDRRDRRSKGRRKTCSVYHPDL